MPALPGISPLIIFCSPLNKPELRHKTVIAEFRDFVILGFLIEDSECHFPQFHNHTIPKSLNPVIFHLLDFGIFLFGISNYDRVTFNFTITQFLNPAILPPAGFWNFLIWDFQL
jgi:hypothetical protein